MKKILTSLLLFLLVFSAFGQKKSSTGPGSKEEMPVDNTDVHVISLPAGLVPNGGPAVSKPSVTQAVPLAVSTLIQQEDVYNSNDTPATATPLGGTSVRLRGNLFPSGDIDFYSFSATAGDRVYAAVMTTFSAGSSTDSQLTLIGSDGSTVIEFDDDNGSFAGLSSSIAGATIPTTGTYYLKVNDFTAGTTSEKSYDLYLKVQSGSPTPEVESNDTPATANPLPASGWVSGARNPAAATEQDWYSVTLQAGETVFLSLDLDPERDGVTWNGRLGFALFGDAGNQILVIDDAGTGDVSPNPNIPSEAFFFTVKTAGTYYLFVDSATGATGGPTATYHLSFSKLDAIGGYTSYTSTDVPKAIGPANGSVTSTITIPDTKIIKDLAVQITLNHALMQDIDAILTTPEGNKIALFSDIGAAATGGQTQMDLRLDDYNGVPPTFTVLKNVALMPELGSKLDQLKGMKSNGTWTLTLYDDVNNASGGTLTGWALDVLEDTTPASLSAATTIYSEDFESGAGGFTHSGTADEWALGTPNTPATTTANPVAAFSTANSGVNCWKTDLTGTYNINSDQTLESPDISLTAVTANAVTLSWAMKYQIENATFDHLDVYVEEVGGGSFTQNVFTWLGATQTATPGNPVVNVGMSSGWGTYFADITPFIGKTIRFKVRLTSDNTVVFGGVAIDDVKIYGDCSPPAGPVLAAGNPTTICTGTMASLSATCSVGTVNWYDAASTTLLFTGSPYTTSALTANTVYNVRCENGACVSPFVSTTITVSPASVGGTIAGSSSVCAGTNSTTLVLSGNVGAVQKWQSSLNSSFASPTDIANTTNTLIANNLNQTTYYRAVVKSGACSQAFSSTAVVTVNPSVTASISGATAVCAGQSTTLTASGGNSFHWNTGANTAMISVTAGVYSVTVTNTATGCSGTASTTVTSTSAPTATLSASPSSTLTCAQTSLTLIAGGGNSYAFSGPGIVSQNGATGRAVVNASGTYSVTVTTAGGCTATQTTSVQSNTTTPTASLTNNGPLSAMMSSVTLTAGGGTTYAFSSGATQVGGSSGNTATVTQAGTYSVIVTGANGCTASAQTTVTGSATAGTSQTVCRGSTAVISVPSAQSAGLTYQWYKNGQTAANKMTEIASIQKGTTTTSLTLINNQTSATYYLKATDGSGNFTWYGAFQVSVNVNCSSRLAAESEGINRLQIVVAPNPLQNNHLKAVVTGASGRVLRVELVNLRGQPLRQQQWESAGEEQAIDWDLSTQSTGTYVLQAQTTAGDGSAQRQTIKFIKP